MDAASFASDEKFTSLKISDRKHYGIINDHTLPIVTRWRLYAEIAVG